VVPRLLLLRTGVPPEIIESASRGGEPVAVRFVAQSVFNQLCEAKSPQGVLAVFDLPEPRVRWTKAPLVLITDGLRNPGNFGSLLRSAAGAGVTAAFTSHGTVDAYNGKSVRAAMGAHFRLPIVKLDDGQTQNIESRCDQILLADIGALTRYDHVDWTLGTALIISSEATGPSSWAQTIATGTVRIPLSRNVESLNAAVAGSIMLFEAARQRGENARELLKKSSVGGKR
ncbi:MAG: RNA methyltransferase, partial [Chloroflexota bacterium]|nr:RNA methyltransferase [Chloroflexota bacterium]